MHKLLTALLVTLMASTAMADSLSSSTVRLTSADGSKAVTISTGPASGGDGQAQGNAMQVIGGQFLTSLPALTSGKVSFLQLDASGRLLIAQPTASALNVTATLVSGSGVKLLDTGGSNAVTIVANNTAAGNGIQTLTGRYDTALPTLVSGNVAGLELDVSGRVLVGSIAGALPAGGNTIGAVTQASGPWTSNITQVNGASLALGQTTMSASLPVTFASNQSSLSVTQGALTSFTTAQQSVTASAVALGTNTSKGVCIRHLMGGTQEVIYYGATGVSTATGQALYAGDQKCLEITNTNLIFVIAGGTGSSVAYDWVN